MTTEQRRIDWKEAARHYRALYSEAVERGCRDRDFWRGRTFAVEREGAGHRREMQAEIDRLTAARATDRAAELEAFTRLAEFARSRALLLNRGCDDLALADEILDYLGQILGPLPGDAALSGSSAVPDGGG